MRTLLIAAAVAALLLAPRPAAAQVQVTLHLDLPAVLPTLVVVEPGFQVVPRVNEEVFFVDGYYWVRRDVRWYRSHDHRQGWKVVESRHVPARLVQVPPGHYRQWDPSKGKSDKHDGKHHDGHHENHGHEKKHGQDKHD